MTFWLLRNGLVEIGIENRALFYRWRVQREQLTMKLLNDEIKMKKHNIVIRRMEPGDWYHVARIYQEGIDTGDATFQQEVPTWDDWNNGHLEICRLIAEVDNEIAGWAALSTVSKRKVYSGVAEVSVYISSSFRGKGIGTTLLKNLISASEKEKFWTLQAGIFPENIASLNIHEKLGFRRVGFREKIGTMNGVWRDTLLLERRSLFPF